MSTGSATLLAVLVPLLLAWAASTVLVAFAFDRATSRAAGEPALSFEAWLLYASGGAATGGLLGTMLVVREFVLPSSARPEVLRLLLVGAPGMLLGAAFACLLALAAVQWRR